MCAYLRRGVLSQVLSWPPGTPIGKLVVVWTGLYSGADPAVFARQFTSNGLPQGGEIGEVPKGVRTVCDRVPLGLGLPSDPPEKVECASPATCLLTSARS